VSYRARRGLGFGEVASGGLTVGQAASADPILARASLDASGVLLAMAKAQPASRSLVLRQKLDALQPGLGPEVARRLRKNTRNRGQDQALFDAIRSTLADRVRERVVGQIRNSVGNRLGWDVLVDTPLGTAGLGDLAPGDRAIGCSIAGGANTVGGIASIVPFWGTIVKGVTDVGSGIASGAMDCTREQREAQARLAASQAATAQRQLEAAQLAAGHAQVTRRKMFMVGGGVLGVTAILWLILS